MRKELRLSKARDFAAVRKGGRRWVDDLLVLMARPNGLEVTRTGYVVSKRVGGAVIRNRVKRRFREAMRLSEVNPGWDLVLVARRKAAYADYQRLHGSLSRLLGNAGLARRRDSQTPPPGTR